MKRELPIEQANRLINHGPVVLVTSSYKDKINIIPVAWITPVSISPMIIAVSVHLNSFSLDLIEKSEEYVVNVPTVELLDKVNFCGTHSGQRIDKFKETNLTPLKAHSVKPPLIAECIGHIECKVYDKQKFGDHRLFIGAVVSASVDEDKYDKYLKAFTEEAKTFHHLGGDYYITSGNLETITQSVAG